MGVYSIKDLENFTQIKAHTLRIWEQRYNLLNPQRTETNIRFYSDNDLKKILNINLLYANGLKISKIAELSDEEIRNLANEIMLQPDQDNLINLSAIIGLVVDYNEQAIENELTQLRETYSIEYIFTQIFIPLLKKVGELWQVSTISVSHEHFLSNILRNFLIVNTPELGKIKQPKGTVLLFLRENEYHELGLLFYNYYLRMRGYRTVYIGQSMPDNNIKAIVRKVKPDFIFSSLVAQIEKKAILEFTAILAESIDLSKVYLGGFQVNLFDTVLPKAINRVKTIDGIDIP